MMFHKGKAMKKPLSLIMIVTVTVIVGIAGVIPCDAGIYDTGHKYTDGIPPVAEETEGRFAFTYDRPVFATQEIKSSECKLDFQDCGFNFPLDPFSDILRDIQFQEVGTRGIASGIAPLVTIGRYSALGLTQGDLSLDDARLPAEEPTTMEQMPTMVLLCVAVICMASLRRRNLFEK